MKKQQFKPFEQVLVRDADTQPWKCGIFSHCDENENFKYACVGSVYSQCIPYTEKTAHLIGTTKPYIPPKPKTYRVKWPTSNGPHTKEYTDEEFENFIKIAVLNNNDIQNFGVLRICD